VGSAWHRVFAFLDREFLVFFLGVYCFVPHAFWFFCNGLACANDIIDDGAIVGDRKGNLFLESWA